MALNTFVKVSKVTNLSDARYCAGMGVDVIGFNLTPDTEQFVSPDKFNQITEWLAGVDFAGEFEGLNAEEIAGLAHTYNIHYIQISDPSILNSLSAQALPIIFKVDMDAITDLADILPLLQQHHHQVSLFLLESEQEAYKPEMLEGILALAWEYPILLGYGVTASNVSNIIQDSAVKGISLLGEEEIRAGYKDFDKLSEILELLEIDEFED